MISLVMLAMFALVAFLVAWVVNGLVGLLSGERPKDTGSVWLDIFLRLFAVLELGFIGRILCYVGFDGLPKKIVLFVCLLCALLFLVRVFPRHRDDGIHTFSVQLTNTPNTALEPTPTTP